LSVVRQRRKRSKIGPKIFTILMLALLFWIGIVALRSWLTTVMLDVQLLHKGTIEKRLDVTFSVLRNEYSVSAPSAGVVEFVAQEGQKVPKDGVVAYFSKVEGTSLEKTSRVPLKAPLAGIFSLRVDGLENICHPDSWASLETDKVLELVQGLDESRLDQAEIKGQVQAGQPLFKIVDNLSPTYLFLSTELLTDQQFEKGKSLELCLPQIVDKQLSGVITELHRENGRTELLIRISTPQNIEKYRQLHGELIIDKYQGIIIQENMLVYKDGIPGVYLFHKGRALWQEVNVQGQVEQQLAVIGLEEGQWIIATPNLVKKEGQRVFRR